MEEIYEPLLTDKKLIDLLDDINLSYKNFIEQCNFIDSQIIETTNNQLNIEIENRINLKNNFTELSTKIKNALKNEEGIIIEKLHQNKLNEMLILLDTRYQKIINDYNKLYIDLNDDDDQIHQTETKATFQKKNTGLSTSMSSIVSSANTVDHPQMQSDRYFLFVVVSIFLFISFLILFYFDKIIK